MNDLLKMLEYNFWANDIFIGRVKEHDYIPEEIKKQISHILLAHRIWLQRIATKGTLASAWDEINEESWEGLNIELYNETTDIIKSQDLNITVFYKNSAGERFENKLCDIVNHLIIHSAHHRAQLALLMRKEQILPPKSDYIFYVRGKNRG